MHQRIPFALFVITLSLGQFAASTASCRAGVIPGRWEKFDKKAKVGDALYVETSSGLAVWGELAAVDADSFRLRWPMVPDVTIQRSEALRVEKRIFRGAPIVILFPASVGLLAGAATNPKVGLITFGALETLELVALVRRQRKIAKGEPDTELLYLSVGGQATGAKIGKPGPPD